MTRFYASICGSHGEATRQGTKASGIVGHIRGWNIGIRVSGHVDSDGEDIFVVSLSSGSNNDLGSVLIGSYTREDLEAMLAKGDEK